MKIYLGIICLLLVQLAWAQPPGGRNRPQGQGAAITGTVADNQGRPIPYATVALFSARDSVLRKGVVTDESGAFELNGRVGGRFFLKVSFLSYRELTTPVMQLTSQGHDFGTLRLLPDVEQLEEVVIEGEQSVMEMKLDKRVFNVGKDIGNSGANGAEVLDNVPSVEVDIDGNVSLRGSENVQILIDGKQSGMVGADPASALRQLQGNMIERVEVITNPSARYDAEGEVGIINIVLKKQQEAGINGAVEAVVGYPDNHRAGFNLNVRGKNLNFFGGYGLAYRKTPGNGFSDEAFSNPDTSYTFYRSRDHERGGLSHNFRGGIDYFLDSTNTLTAAFLYRYSKGDNTAKLVYDDYDINGELINRVIRDEIEEEIKENKEFSISHRKTFKKKDQLWTTDFKWIESDDTEDAALNESSLAQTDPILQLTDNVEDERMFLFQSDYVLPTSKDGRLEGGVKTTIRKIQNNYSVQLEDSLGMLQLLDQFNDNFTYNENIYAAYLMYGNKKGAFSYQLGLRAEYTDLGTELEMTGETNDRNYLDWFPSAHFSYELNATNTVQISYSRRISRPRFRHLLPFYGFSDSRVFFAGNPNLNPEYSNSFELGLLRYFEKGSLLSSVYYRRRNGVIERITQASPSGMSQIIPVNLAIQNAYGFEFSLSYNPIKVWRMTGSFNFYRAITEGNFEGLDLSSDTYTWNSRLISRISIKPSYQLQLSAMYRAPRILTQGTQRSISSVDVGLSKDVLHKKGTLTFSVRDLFNSRKRRSEVDIENYSSVSEFQWRSRQFLLSFNYRINQKKGRQRRDRSIFENDGNEGM